MDPTSDNPLPPGPEDEKTAKRGFNRREVIFIVGAGGVAAGFGLAKVLSDDDGGGSSTPGGRGSNVTTATDETSPSTIPSRSKPPKTDPPATDVPSTDTPSTETSPPPPDDVAGGLPEARWSDPGDLGRPGPRPRPTWRTIDRPVLLDVDADGRRRAHRAPRGARLRPGQRAGGWRPAATSSSPAGSRCARPTPRSSTRSSSSTSTRSGSSAGTRHEPIDDGRRPVDRRRRSARPAGTPKTSWTHLDRRGEAQAATDDHGRRRHGLAGRRRARRHPDRADHGRRPLGAPRPPCDRVDRRDADRRSTSRSTTRTPR